MSESHWTGKSVPQMWASAQAADTQTAWQQVNAWRRTHDLLLHHAGRLKACADELSYAWPPERSPAAQAFVEYITELHTAIMRASVDAATNYGAIAGVLTSLSSAKADMAKVMQEWSANESGDTAEKAWRASGGPDWQETLNAKARSRMAQNDQEVLEASRRLVEMASPQERPYWSGVPFDSGLTSGTSSGGARGPQNPDGASGLRITAPTVSPADAANEELGLAGAPTGLKPGGTSDQVVVPAVSQSELTPVPPISNPSVGALGRTPVAGTASSGESSRTTRTSSLPAGPLGSGNGRASVSPLATGAGRGPGRVNPVGGVIDPNRPTSSGAALPFMGGARGTAESRRDSNAALTMSWDVPQGVAPVIEPAPELPYELGPGVIGIDR